MSDTEYYRYPRGVPEENLPEFIGELVDDIATGVLQTESTWEAQQDLGKAVVALIDSRIRKAMDARKPRGEQA